MSPHNPSSSLPAGPDQNWAASGPWCRSWGWSCGNCRQVSVESGDLSWSGDPTFWRPLGTPWTWCGIGEGLEKVRNVIHSQGNLLQKEDTKPFLFWRPEQKSSSDNKNNICGYSKKQTSILQYGEHSKTGLVEISDRSIPSDFQNPYGPKCPKTGLTSLNRLYMNTILKRV